VYNFLPRNLSFTSTKLRASTIELLPTPLGPMIPVI